MYRSIQLVALLLFLIFMLMGCNGAFSKIKHLIDKDPNPVVTNPHPENNDSNKEKLVPFTEDIKLAIEKNKIDIKKIQFYIKKGLVLRREIGQVRKSVKVGNVIEENGKKFHEVIIKDLTPGLCESVEGKEMNISFDSEKNTLLFFPNDKNVYAIELDPKEKTYIRYQNERYEASYLDNDKKTAAVLMIKKSDAEDLKKGKRPVEGRLVN